jgi:hypothetical protein
MGDRVKHWKIIAESATAAHGMHIQTFGPYVPSVNNRGLVAYQATLASGGTIIVASDGTASTVLVPRAATSLESALESHPDLNDAGDYCAYGNWALPRTMMGSSLMCGSALPKKKDTQGLDAARYVLIFAL